MPFCNKIGKFQDVQCGLIHLLSNLNVTVPVPLKRVDLGKFVFEVYGWCRTTTLNTTYFNNCNVIKFHTKGIT